MGYCSSYRLLVHVLHFRALGIDDAGDILYQQHAHWLSKEGRLFDLHFDNMKASSAVTRF